MFTMDLHCDVIYFCAVSTRRFACLFVCLRLAALPNGNRAVSTKLAAKQRYEIGPRSRISSLRGQGKFHVEKDTSIGKS